MRKEQPQNNGKAWLKKEMRPYRASIAFLTFLTVTASLSSLAFAYLVRFVIDNATDRKATLLWTFAAILLGLVLLKILLKTIDAFYAEKLRAKMTAELRTKLFSKIIRSNYAKISEYHSGNLLNRLTTDVQEVVADTVGLVPTLAAMGVQCIGSIIALLTIDPLFTGLYVVCGAAFGGLAALFRRQLKKRQKDVLQADGDHRAFMQEGVSSTMTLKAYGAENKTTEKASIFAQKYYGKRMKRNTLRSFMSALFSLLSNSGLILAVVWGGVSVYNGNKDFGEILSVILLLMQFQQPLTGFSAVIPAYYSRIASGERLAEIDDIPSETIADGLDFNYNDLSKIRFANVTFSYGRDIVLNQANVEITKGDIVCLTGASGSGKSTLFKLLLDVYKPMDGVIYLDGAFVGGSLALTAKHRSVFAYVPQGNFLFSGTIYENLTFFVEESEITEEKLANALKTACAEFVWELPDGVQTVLREDGAGLSEGQMQRLAVARAILSERPILLLDEATSALDGETEKRLLENIRSLSGKTCLIVTHRPAALDIADHVLNVEEGKIVVTK